jgi:ribose 5-phosphate isomerase A
VSADDDKRAAAEAALTLVRDGMVLGLGTGSTAEHFIRALGRSGLKVRGVPTSRATRDLAVSLGIELCTLADVTWVDLDVDGADLIDPALNLVKGRGGALLYEKIVAAAAKRFVVIADSSKEVERFGVASVPVEVVPFGEPLVERRLRALNGEPTLRLRPDGQPFVTDAGHHIFDVRIDLGDPHFIGQNLLGIPGLVEHGLFLDMADTVLVARDGRVTEHRR